MAKNNITSSNKINKAERIQPAIRNDESIKWKQRLNPTFINGSSYKITLFKLKSNSDLIVLSNNTPQYIIEEFNALGINFENLWFNFNKKRHILGGSNQS